MALVELPATSKVYPKTTTDDCLKDKVMIRSRILGLSKKKIVDDLTTRFIKDKLPLKRVLIDGTPQLFSFFLSYLFFLENNIAFCNDMT